MPTCFEDGVQERALTAGVDDPSFRYALTNSSTCSLSGYLEYSHSNPAYSAK